MKNNNKNNTQTIKNFFCIMSATLLNPSDIFRFIYIFIWMFLQIAIAKRFWLSYRRVMLTCPLHKARCDGAEHPLSCIVATSGYFSSMLSGSDHLKLLHSMLVVIGALSISALLQKPWPHWVVRWKVVQPWAVHIPAPPPLRSVMRPWILETMSTTQQGRQTWVRSEQYDAPPSVWGSWV